MNQINQRNQMDQTNQSIAELDCLRPRVSEWESATGETREKSGRGGTDRKVLSSGF